MTTFLGVPIVIEGQAWGNLYLTEKDGGEFTEDDEEAAVVLADWAAIAIRNSRLYRDVRERRDELERTNRGLETTTEISRALAGVTDLDRVLELVVKRSRALIDARAAEIALLEGDEFVIAAVAGEGVEGRRGLRLPVGDSLAGVALKSGRLERIEEIPPTRSRIASWAPRSALVTPMSFRDRPVGFLIVFDRLRGDRPFNEEDERLLEAFAASAAMAVATAQHAGDEALRRSLEASEQERSRWARELHDETLQQLAGLRVLLPARGGAETRTRIDGAVVEAHRAPQDGHRGPAFADHRPAARGARRVRRQGCARDAGHARGAAVRCDGRARGRTRRRRRRARAPALARDRVDGVPGRAGGAHQRRSSTRRPTRVQVRVSDRAETSR